MPQMAPIMWFSLFQFFIFIMVTMSCSIFFTNTPSIFMLNLNTNKIEMKKIWKL